MDTLFRAALFDLDGVVLDTEGQYTKFWAEQCRQYYPNKPGLEYKVKGQTLVQIFDKYFSGMDLEQAEITKRLNNFELSMSFPYIEGFQEFVKSLRKQGIKTAIITSSNKEKMKAVYLKLPEFKDMFDEILTSEDFSKSKPDPDCYLKGASRFSLSANHCIVFEDSFNGLKSARAAAMRVVALATTNPKEEIEPLSDYVIENFRELNYEKLIEKLF